MKGPVYLRDVSGNLAIPENALSLNPDKYKSEMKIIDFQADEDKNQMILLTNAGQIAVNLFDHVTVRIKVMGSRAHLSPIKFDLVHFGADPNTQDLPPENVIITPEEGTDTEMIPTEEFDVEKDFLQTSDEESLYKLFERLQALSIADIQDPGVGASKSTTFKRKGRRVFKEAELYPAKEEADVQPRGPKAVEDKYKERIETAERAFKLKTIKAIKNKRKLYQ